MTRGEARNRILSFQPFSEESRLARIEFTAFLDRFENAAERSLELGHFTASAWIVSRDRTSVLLTRHRKLEKWIPLGGHCDGDLDFERVARREALEESGLTSVEILSPDPIELRRHEIPEHGGTPAHFHYDVRYLFEADENEKLQIDERESLDLAWVKVSELPSYTGEIFLIDLATRVQTMPCARK